MGTLRLETTLTVAAIALVVGGCLLVLSPFLSALLWAVILTFSTWGLYERLLQKLGGRATLAALVMTLGLVTVLVVPLVAVTLTLGDNLRNLTTAARHVLDTGMPAAPLWFARVPLLGASFTEYWDGLREAHGANGDDLLAWLETQAAPISRWLLARGLAFGQALLQLTLVVLVAFFLYRDGAAAAVRLRAGIERLAGQRARGLLDLAGQTVRGVVYGLLGTALAQALLAVIGFAVAGVPGPMVLGLLVFGLSIIPFGPPLVWLPASFWLLHEGQPGWAIFMFVWGLVLISSIDNVLRPYLISQGTTLPFVLVLLGVIGGLLGFGFIGIFLGPTLLAVGFAMLREWTRNQSPPAMEGPPPPAG